MLISSKEIDENVLTLVVRDLAFATHDEEIIRRQKKKLISEKWKKPYAKSEVLKCVTYLANNF